jgi:hypothetical protein
VVTGAAFYGVADARYFLGAVGLVNSLRLLGHREPIFVLDLGLTPAQRRMLDPEVNLVEGPPGIAPWLAKTIAPLLHPAEVMVLIDADMVVARSLGDLIERASGDRVVVFENDRDRFRPDWGELLDLGAIRRRRYVSSGLVFLGGAEGRAVLELLDDRQRRAEVERGYYGDGEPDYAFTYPEQDVLNAILASRPDAERVATLATKLAPVPPFRGLRVLDERTLRCAFKDGTEPYVLHQIIHKPWLEPMYHGPYSRLLARLVLSDDVAIRVPPGEVPLRMRRGARALLARKRVDVQDLARWYARDVIPEWVEARMASLRGRSGGRS